MPSEGKRLFGTDGVRGVANSVITPEFALALGRAAGNLLESGPVIVGRDTRRSGEMLSLALQAGFHASGIDTHDVGVLPSGGVAHLTQSSGATMGAIISASHNPAPDNGIKFLGPAGFKLTDEEEDKVDARFRQGAPWSISLGDAIGTRYVDSEAAFRYVDFLAGATEYSLRGIEVALDCANGAAYKVAPDLFRKVKVDVVVHADIPDGTNINDGVGATHPEFLAKQARGRIGLCFDGDADRLIAIDEDGVPANGDVVMAVIARHLKEQGRLENDIVIGTVMSNLGFRRAMEELDIEFVAAAVGDRYVLEAMKKRKAVLGGEQSGHVIFLDTAPSGDGLLSALRLLEVVASSGKTLSELRSEVITEYPQVLRNVRVKDVTGLADAEGLWAAVSQAETRLGPDGRILIRASGTEPFVRVMVEAASKELATELASDLALVTRNELGA